MYVMYGTVWTDRALMMCVCGCVGVCVWWYGMDRALMVYVCGCVWVCGCVCGVGGWVGVDSCAAWCGAEREDDGW